MARTGQTRAQANREMRQKELRDLLASQGHLQHVTDIALKLTSLDSDLDQLQVQRLRAAADIKLKLINKYLGDVRSVEIGGEDGGPVKLLMAWDED